LLVGLSVWQQPFREELCDGYATLHLNAPYGGGFQAAHVLSPLRLCETGRGFFVSCSCVLDATFLGLLQRLKQILNHVIRTLESH
jgi:hypothetical protein